MAQRFITDRPRAIAPTENLPAWQQSSSRATGGHDYYGDEGRARGVQRVSPGGEYLQDRDPRSNRGKGPKGYRRSDERIREDVCDLLSDNPKVDATDIEVSVENGEVTLSGTVRSRDDKRRAEYVADAISGVRDVHNQLRLV